MSSCLNADIKERVETLFILNNEYKRYEHICSVVKQIDSIAVQYNLDRYKYFDELGGYASFCKK